MRFIQLGRREFIALIGGAAATWPLGARAQQPAKTMKRIALVAASTPIADQNDTKDWASVQLLLKEALATAVQCLEGCV